MDHQTFFSYLISILFFFFLLFLRDEEYGRARREACTPSSPKRPGRTAAQKLEDYYRLFRTWLVLLWILSNAILVIVISSTQVADLLTSALPEDALKEGDIGEDGKNLFVTNRYFSFILWSIAGLALIRFLGSVVYLGQWILFKGY